MTPKSRPNMHPVDVVIVICVTLVVLVGLYSTAGCGGADFQVMDGEEDAAPQPTTETEGANDGGGTDTGELHQADTATMPDAAPVVDSALDSKATESTPADVASCTHGNGLGQSYTLCVPAGNPGVEASYSMDMAKRARAAWPTPGTDGEGACADGAPLMVWRKTATSCAAWAYTNGVGAFAGTAGRVYLGSAACSCPSSSCPAWN